MTSRRIFRRTLSDTASLLALAWLLTLSTFCVGQQPEIPNPFEDLPPFATTPASQPDAAPPAKSEQAPTPTPNEQLEVELEPKITEPRPAEAAPPPGLLPEVMLGNNNQPAVLPKRDVPTLDRAFSKAVLIDASGPIMGRFHWYLNQRLDTAKSNGADLVIIRLTSPGGDLEHSLQLSRRLRDIDWATTIVFVPSEAISGGAIISFGADYIVMQPGALIGDAGPVKLGMQGFEHAEEKVVSYLAGAIRELAEAKGRPGAIAEAMVDRSLKVVQTVELNTGRRVFLTEQEFSAAEAEGLYGPAEPVAETGQDRFLTVGAQRAEELLLCERLVDSEDALLASLQIETLERTELNWLDGTIYLLNRPWLTAILLIAGLIGLYIEFAAPGISVAGLFAVLCFGIFFWSHALGGTSGWLEILLFTLGIGCLLCELFVLPGFGVFGLTGLGLVVVSLVMASQDFVIPDTATQWTELRTNLLIVLGAVLGVMLLLVAQVLLLDSIPGLNRFRLAAPESEISGDVGHAVASVSTDYAPSLLAGSQDKAMVSVGARGTADSDLRPSGKIRIDDRLVDVVTEGDYVEAGRAVEVIKTEGNLIIVRVIQRPQV